MKGESAMDEVLEMLEKTAKRIQKAFDESKEAVARQTTAYEQALSAKETPEAQKIKIHFGRALELERLERMSIHLSLLYMLQIFAFKVKVLEITVTRLNELLQRSNVLEKSMEIDEVKKHIEALKILVEAQYESLKDLKSQNMDLKYIF
jgi:archaellum component FlaC